MSSEATQGGHSPSLGRVGGSGGAWAPGARGFRFHTDTRVIGLEEQRAEADR